MRCIYKNGNYAMTEGEEFMLDFLNQTLPLEYEIYIQPNLYGNRPDMILFHEKQGIFIVEIKDWKLERYYKKNGILFKKDGECDLQVSNPSFQIDRYRYLCSNFDENIPITCIGYFHNAHSSEVERLFQGNNIKFFGYDNFKTIKTFILLTKHSEIKNQEKIKNFLNPPHHKKEEGEEIKLTQQQRDLIEHNPRSWRRVKGVAGAGKTIVITQKAANIASCNKKVLIICFNKTLKSYIKENLNKTKQNFDWNLIECHHFHEFVKIFIEENDLVVENKSKFFDEYEKRLLESAKWLIQSQKNNKMRKYDAILIDEAQDFKKEWFDFLLYFLSENDEVLLVADDKQNLYDREISWINESMAGYGYKFKGSWGILKDNIRQRKFPEVIEESNRFFNLFLKDYLNLHPNKSFGTSIECTNIQKSGLFKRLFNSVELFWKNIQNHHLQKSLLETYQDLLKQGYTNKNIIILVSTKQSGREIKDFLISQNINAKTFFDSKGKEDFLIHSDDVKIITIHSFKGLENGVIIFISNGKDDILGDFETYVAITRATEYLVVLNTKEKYKDYGKGWDKYH